MPENPSLFDGAYGKNETPTYHTAITLRDLFAGMAMNGMVQTFSSMNIGEIATGERGGNLVTQAAYRIADAMLAEREKEKP